MRHYELLVVLSPMLNQEQVSETWDKIKGFITTREAEISHEEQWGTRRLAYPIRKGQHRFLEGSYHLTRFATENSFNIELENFLKVDEEVLRSLVTVTLPEEELAEQAAAAARAIRTPPPRPAPLAPDGSPMPAPADGEAPPPAADTGEGTASAAEAPVAAEASEEPVAAAEEEPPVAEAEAEEPEPEPEAEEPEPAPEEESGPAAPEGGDGPEEEPEVSDSEQEAEPEESEE